MKPRSITSAISAVLLSAALSGTALAVNAQTAGNAAIEAQPYGPSETAAPSAQIQTSNLVGKTVTDNQGQTIGTVEQVLLQPSGQVDYVIVSSADQPGKSWQIPWSDVNIRNGSQVALNTSKDQLNSQFSAFESMPESSLAEAQNRCTQRDFASANTRPDFGTTESSGELTAGGACG